MTELEGKTLDRYELRRLIGKGGMANVYEAIDKPTGRIVAVKIFKREDEEMLRRFMREAQLMASWRENHLVPIYNYGTGELDNFTHYFIVMPYMEGGTLRARIRRGPLPLVEACHVIQDVASALDYIHKHGVIHRDIKASNVLISGDGNYFLTDFGIARITSAATQLTTTGNVLGTVDYVAPELFELDRKADVRSDLYSLGVLLYEMVTGRLPFIAENQIALVSMHIQRRPPSPRSIIPGIPAPVERVMLKALEKKPEQRYGSARDLAEAFCRAVASGTGVSIPDYATVAPPDLLGSTPGSRPDQLILALPPPSNMPEPGRDRPNVRPSPRFQRRIRFRNHNLRMWVRRFHLLTRRFRSLLSIPTGQQNGHIIAVPGSLLPLFCWRYSLLRVRSRSFSFLAGRQATIQARPHKRRRTGKQSMCQLPHPI